MAVLNIDIEKELNDLSSRLAIVEKDLQAKEYREQKTIEEQAKRSERRQSTFVGFLWGLCLGLGVMLVLFWAKKTGI